jgi:ATP-dependent Clp protease ATP-binding subunit ClpC
VTDRFEKFNGPAQTALSMAQDEAQRFQHNYIGTEHLLLGLTRQNDDVVAKVLVDVGIDLNRVRSAVERKIGHGDSTLMGRQIGLTPKAKRVLQNAVDEARRLRHDHVGTEHLLLGLIDVDDSLAAVILTEHGISLDNVRTRVLDVFPRGTGNAA